MNEKIVHRRSKPTVNIKQENLLLTATTKKRQSQLRRRKPFLLWEYLFKSIYLIIGLAILGSLYLFLTRWINVEYTNRPIDLPKLVNNTISERFWGTYR